MADEIDPADARVKELFAKLWNDKKLGGAVRAMAKEQYPDVVLPEDAFEPAFEPIRAENKALQARLDAMEAERKAEREEADKTRTERNLQEALDNARSKFNLTDEGFDKMVTRMKATGNYNDAEAAAAWVAQQTPPPPAPGPSWMPQRLNPFDGQAKEDLKLLHEDPQAFEDMQLRRFFENPESFTNEALGFAA